MIPSFSICNFRLFKELTIQTLGRVNLIVGKNNSGKSCLLEALYIYAQSASPKVLYQLIEERGEDWELENQREIGEEIKDLKKHPLRHLFYGYQLPQKEQESIVLKPSSENEEESCLIRCASYLYTDSPDQKGKQRIRIEEGTTTDPLEEIDCFLEVEDRGKRISLNSLNRDLNTYFSENGSKRFSALALGGTPLRVKSCCCSYRI